MRGFQDRAEVADAVALVDARTAPLPAESVPLTAAAGRVLAADAVPPGRHVGRRGEDVEPGTAVLRAGRRLRPQDVGVLASVGASPVAVVRQPVVTILVTGDELLPPGSRPEGHRIVDSNSVMLAALCVRDGGRLEQIALLPDRYDRIRAALADCGSDVILVSGGSSVGQEDHAPRVL